MDCISNSSDNQYLDSLLQEVRSLKIKNNTLENTIDHLKEDNEMLLKQRDDAVELLKVERSEFKLKIGKKDIELFQVRENLDQLKEDIEKEKLQKEDIDKPQVSVLEENNETLLMQNYEYKTEIEDLKSQLQVCKEIDLSNKDKIVKLEQEKCLLKNELEESKNLLENKTQQLQEITASFEELKEEKLLLSSELAALKSAPSDINNRGNSLFGEVEDRRQAMSSKLKMLYQKYMLLKKNYIRKNSDYDRLKAELNLLQTKWNNDQEAGPKADERLIAAQNRRIKDLMDRVTQLENRPEHPQFVTIDEYNLSWALSFIEKARNEAAELRNELDRYSLNQYSVEQALRSKTSEVLRLNEEILKLRAENVKLQLANETQKEIDSTSTENTDDSEKDKILNKENIPTTVTSGRRVHFKDNDN